MDGEVKHDAHFISAITGIAGNLQKQCVSASAKLRALNLSLSSLQMEIRQASETPVQPTTLMHAEVDSQSLPSLSEVRSMFSKTEAETVRSASSARGLWKKMGMAGRVAGSTVRQREGTPVASSSSASDYSAPQIIDGHDSTLKVDSTSSTEFASNLSSMPITPSGLSRKPALSVESESSSDTQDINDQEFRTILAAQTVTKSLVSSEESKRVESGQKASLALRANVVLLKLCSPHVSAPCFGTDCWLHTEGDLVVSRTYRPSDANGKKLSEEQYYKYVNIDPGTLDAHVRACYRVYFGEQVSVSRPSGRHVPSCCSDDHISSVHDQDSDMLLFARLCAKKPFLVYSSWQKNSYVNLETQKSSNDPFETTRSDPRTRLLIQFQSLQMKLLEHPDFQGVEPLFATAFVFSTGKNVGRRVSEMVHFDFNSEEMLMNALHPHLSAIDPLSRCTNMLFNLSKQSEHYFLVVIVDRLYGSDDNSAYISPGKFHKNPKARAELVQRLSKNASKYGYARRPFAWTAHRLFEHRENQLHLVEGPITLDNFWTISNDAIKPFDLYSAIQLTFSPTKSHQSSLSLGYEMLKIEGSLRFTVHEWRGFCKTRIRSVEQSALAVTLFDATRSGITFSDPSVSIFDSMHVVEVVELDSMARLSYSTFNNFVFVAPIAINLAGYDKFGTFHAPSLMVTACLCERAHATGVGAPAEVSSLGMSSSGLNEFSAGLQCCIGKSSIPSLVSCSVDSHVAEFTKYSRFHDVMKMTLKPRIAPGTHVLFQVYDINTKSGDIFRKVTKSFFKGSQVNSLKQVIGYAFTLIDGGSSNPSDETGLPLYRELPADYIQMTPAALEQYRILPFELPFHVSLTYQSTIQPKHPQLIEFFREYSNFVRIMDAFESLKRRNTRNSIEIVDKNLLQITKKIEDSLSVLAGSPNEALHHYFPILCNQILFIVSGSLQILDYESDDEEMNQDADLSEILIQGENKSDYTALEESYIIKSILFRQRVFGTMHSGQGMWLTLADTALESLAGIFTQIERHHAAHASSASTLPGERSIMKRTYVEDVFDNLKNESGIVGFYLILAWQTNLQTRSNADFNLNDLEQHIGVLLDIIYKSYILCFQKELSSFPSDECPHALHHGPFIHQFVDSLMLQLSQKYMKFRTSDSDRSAEAQMVKYSMCELVIFVRDCARIFGSRCSFRFFHSILKHIYSLEDEVMRQVDFYFGSDFFNLRLEVIRIFMDSPYFVPMCRIHTVNPDACIDFDSALSQSPFAALLLTQLDEVTAKGFRKECAAVALAVMFHVLSSFDDDFRLQNAEIRTKVAVMFWPFVRICLRFLHNMMGHTLSTESWHYLLSCFIFIISNVPDGFVSRWCSLQSPRIISYFVQILHRAVKEFTIDTNTLGLRDVENSPKQNSVVSKSSFFTACIERSSSISLRRLKSQDYLSFSRRTSDVFKKTVDFTTIKRTIVHGEDTVYLSQTDQISDELSCTGELLYETKIIEKINNHLCLSYPVFKHFSDQFSTQMVLSVLASLHDVIDQFSSRLGAQNQSLDISRDDIDVRRLEECVNDLFVTCFSRPYCFSNTSTHVIITFKPNFKVWNECLPLVIRCFAMWSTAFPLKTKIWQEFFYHSSNLKQTKYEGLPAHEDIISLLEENLIRGHLSQEMAPLSIQELDDDTDEKSATVNKVVKSSENGKQLLAATVEKIIDALVFREAEFGSTFKEVFFCGFRNFIEPMRLLCYLMGCVENVINDMSTKSPDGNARPSWSQKSATIPRVMNLLKYWITTYGSDWDEHLLTAAHVLIERCTSRVMEIVPAAETDDHIDVAAIDSASSVDRNRSNSAEHSNMFPKRVPSFRSPLPVIKETPVTASASPSAINQPNQSSAASATIGSALANANAMVASSVSNLLATQKSPPHTHKLASPTPRSSHEIVLTTFQVFVRAMIKHLKSSSRLEQDPSDGAFDTLPSKVNRSPMNRSNAVFQFFRQNIDAGEVFLMTSPKHWAQSLTLHSFHIFKKFQAEEFFRQPFPAWQVKPESLKKVLVPNISANTDFFNLIKDFLVGCLFRSENSSRKRVLMHIIDIAYCMKQMNNFDGMFSSMSALDSVGVYRLKKLWSSVSTPEYEAKLAELRFLMESRNKYANYTAALRTASPPKLPYVGHFLGSLFMQSERHPKIIKKQEAHLINFGRYYGLHDVVFHDILVHRTAQYHFTGPDDISKEAATDLLAYVKTPHPWLLSGDEEYDRSHRDEPCERIDCPVCSVNRGVERPPSVSQ